MIYKHVDKDWARLSAFNLKTCLTLGIILQRKGAMYLHP